MMKYLGTIITISVMVLVLAAGNALAVGYERYEPGGSSAVGTAKATSARPDLYTALKDASLVEKCPALLDQATSFVKDILGQFGLTDRKAP